MVEYCADVLVESMLRVSSSFVMEWQDRVESVSMVSEVPWCWAVVVEKVEKDVEDASSGTVGSSS